MLPGKTIIFLTYYSFMKVRDPFLVEGKKKIMKFKHSPIGNEHNTFTFSLPLKYSQTFLA